jgi:hypothetical protein
VEDNIIAFKESEPEAQPDAQDQSHCSSIQFVVFSFSHKTSERERERGGRLCVSFLLFQVLALVSPSIS